MMALWDISKFNESKIIDSIRVAFQNIQTTESLNSKVRCFKEQLYSYIQRKNRT